MKNLFVVFLLGLFVFSSPVEAAKVNLKKEGTPWVWQVDDTSWLYTVLTAVGWTSTSDAANVPAVPDILVSTNRLILETGDALLLENSNGLQLEV